MAHNLSAGDGLDPLLAPNPVVQRLAADRPEVARELERLLAGVHEVAALAERTTAEQGEAATLAWLSRIWRELDRELRWCNSIPRDARHACASMPMPRRRRDEVDLGPTPGRK